MKRRSWKVSSKMYEMSCRMQENPRKPKLRTLKRSWRQLRKKRRHCKMNWRNRNRMNRLCSKIWSNHRQKKTIYRKNSNKHRQGNRSTKKQFRGWKLNLSKAKPIRKKAKTKHIASPAQWLIRKRRKKNYKPKLLPTFPPSTTSSPPWNCFVRRDLIRTCS